MLEDNFWDDVDNANKVNAELSYLKKEISQIQDLNDSILNLNSIVELLENEEDESLQQELENAIQGLTKNIEQLELSILLGHENDKLNCYLEIHPGAGGTESCDWAAMLLRMYTRFCEKNNFSYEIIDEQKGEEAGIKSVTILIKGLFAYG